MPSRSKKVEHCTTNTAEPSYTDNSEPSAFGENPAYSPVQLTLSRPELYIVLFCASAVRDFRTNLQAAPASNSRERVEQKEVAENARPCFLILSGR